MMTPGNMVLKFAPGSTGTSATHWGSLWSCFGGHIQFPQRQVWKITLKTAVFSLILGFRPKLRSQKGHENAQNGLGYQVGITRDGLETIPGHFDNFNLSVFNFLKMTGWKRYWPPPFISSFSLVEKRKMKNKAAFHDLSVFQRFTGMPLTRPKRWSITKSLPQSSY